MCICRKGLLQIWFHATSLQFCDIWCSHKPLPPAAALSPRIQTQLKRNTRKIYDSVLLREQSKLSQLAPLHVVFHHSFILTIKSMWSQAALFVSSCSMYVWQKLSNQPRCLCLLLFLSPQSSHHYSCGSHSAGLLAAFFFVCAYFLKVTSIVGDIKRKSKCEMGNKERKTCGKKIKIKENSCSIM